ncbi:Zn-dependent peptidase ImmA (M78 family) [Litoreibacter meonggei]|uniref:Zn-dependent peptidase ImmA (M78 family) n=1 Tax=Litoreibacter meonggei TaxID=1049199 RepID=A0A497X1E0_9RHOB|nr:ImmA/IrrE family metallo-endopeptidase [Litoreibacter meonggei]RLJ59415.1 Zn-dependent peptidase ImmA (M78 family) [Litoreibacter meonggei]
MARTTISISTNALEWAMKRMGQSPRDLENDFPKIEEWLLGDTSPTFPQVEALAQALGLPSAVLFARSPPDLPDPTKSFRSLPMSYRRKLPRHLMKRIIAAQSYQISTQEVFGPENQRLNRKVLDAIRKGKNARHAAAAARSIFGVSFEEQRSWNGDAGEALAKWRTMFFEAGIFVFLDALKSNDVSGFCLYDKNFPIIVLNNSHAKSRQIFTLFHELAHIGKEVGGIDSLKVDPDRLDEKHSGIERYCDNFAAEFLAPISELKRLVHNRPDAKDIEEIARSLKISRLVVLRSFFSEGLVDRQDYSKLMQLWIKSGSNSGSGGNYYNTKRAYLGNEFLSRVFQLYNSARIDNEDASRLLDVAPKNLEGLRPRGLGI